MAHAIVLLLGVILSIFGNDLTPGFWSTAWVAIGTSLIAGAASGMLIWVYMAYAEKDARRIDNMRSAGISWIYPVRAAQIRREYSSRLDHAEKKIDIIGFGLSDFRRDYMERLPKMSDRASIRILVLDPNSPFAKQRDIEEGRPANTISGQSAEFIEHFKRVCPLDSESLKLRMYHCLPLVNIFRIDDEIFWGPYLVGQSSSNTLTMRVAIDGILARQLMEHFETVWAKYSSELPQNVGDKS